MKTSFEAATMESLAFTRRHNAVDCCNKKRMPSDVIPVARFMGIPESPYSGYSPATVEIPASHKTRAGMTRSCGLFMIICNSLSVRER